MTDAETVDRAAVKAQLDTALAEIRQGSLSQGLDMLETLRDELGREPEEVEDVEE